MCNLRPVTYGSSILYSLFFTHYSLLYHALPITFHPSPFTVEDYDGDFKNAFANQPRRSAICYNITEVMQFLALLSNEGGLSDL